MALRSRDDEQLVLDVHAVDAVLALQRADGLRTLQVPELDRLVPGAGRDVVLAARLEPAHALDGFLVGLGLLCLYLAAGGDVAEVDNVEVAGGVAGCYSCAVLHIGQLSRPFPFPCCYIPLTIQGPERALGTQTATCRLRRFPRPRRCRPSCPSLLPRESHLWARTGGPGCCPVGAGSAAPQRPCWCRR